MKPLVYLAGPYTRPDPVENTHHMIQIADLLLADGVVVPFVPHLSLLWHLVSPKPLAEWYEYDLHLLDRCNAVYRVSGESTGADAEVVYAQNKGLPIFTEIPVLYRWAERCKLRDNA